MKPPYVVGVLVTLACCALAQEAPKEAPKPELGFPPLEKVTEGYEKVVSSMEIEAPFYALWRRNKDQQLLAELPKDFARQRHYFALTVAGGDEFAGLQAGNPMFTGGNMTRSSPSSSPLWRCAPPATINPRLP